MQSWWNRGRVMGGTERRRERGEVELRLGEGWRTMPCGRGCEEVVETWGSRDGSWKVLQ